MVKIGSFDVNAYDRKQKALYKLHCQVSWALIALCVLKRGIQFSDISQFNGLLRDAHSRGKSSFVNDDADYFWSIYLSKRAKKVLGLDDIVYG